MAFNLPVLANIQNDIQVIAKDPSVSQYTVFGILIITTLRVVKPRNCGSISCRSSRFSLLQSVKTES